MDAKPNTSIKIGLNVDITLSEIECRALDALCGYDGGAESFIQKFYDTHGKHYLEPHSKGVHSIFKCVKEKIGPAIHRMDRIKKKLKEYEDGTGNL